MNAFPLPATIAIIYKPFLKNRGNIIVDEMVNNSIRKIRSKNFSSHWLLHSKAYACFGNIAPANNFIKNLEYFNFKIPLKIQRTIFVPFVSSGVKICLKKICKNFFVFHINKRIKNSSFNCQKLFIPPSFFV